MTANRRTGNPERSSIDRPVEPNPGMPEAADLSSDFFVLADTVEAILRQVVGLRAANAVDDQLAQLIRLVDSATWSAPVPMTLLVDGALLRGVLVPSEVSATYLDDALERSARTAVSQLQADMPDEAAEPGEDEPKSTRVELLLQQASAFLQRITRRPFSAAQLRIRQRNANALLALNRWHQNREHDLRLTPLDIPGTYTEPGAVARDVIPYATGQRAITLADVKMLVAGEWLAIPAPLRVSVARVGAWAVDQ